jgi:hypothetical protein
MADSPARLPRSLPTWRAVHAIALRFPALVEQEGDACLLSCFFYLEGNWAWLSHVQKPLGTLLPDSMDLGGR